MVIKTGLPKALLHFLLWACYFLIIVYSVSMASEFEFALAIGLRTVFVHSFIFYANTLFLMPFLLEKKKYIFYVISVLLIAVLAVTLLHFFYELSIIKETLELKRAKYSFNPPTQALFPRWVKSNFISFMAVLFISTIYRFILLGKKEEEQQMALQNEKLQAELKFLKSQISPHFLFNALNNIYALAFIKAEKTAETILKLSNMLRYVLYDCNIQKVPIKLEIAYILNYIDLEKIKSEEAQNIVFDYTNAVGTLKIEPMIFIPFIENSFKHSNIEEAGKGWVEICLRTEKNKIVFTCINSFNPKTSTENSAKGIGLFNVKRRLQLLYPKNHCLHIEKTENKFTVHLTVETV